MHQFITYLRDSQSVVFNSGQKMAVRAFYLIRALTKALTYYYIDRSLRHLLVAIENNWLEGPIGFLIKFLHCINFSTKSCNHHRPLIFATCIKFVIAIVLNKLYHFFRSSKFIISFQKDIFRLIANLLRRLVRNK